MNTQAITAKARELFRPGSCVACGSDQSSTWLQLKRSVLCDNRACPLYTVEVPPELNQLLQARVTALLRSAFIESVESVKSVSPLPDPTLN